MIERGERGYIEEIKKLIDSLKPNKVLNARPPEIDSTEKTLPRPVRTGLARLRTGYSRILNSYVNRLDPDVEDKCPLCCHTPHDTAHLFQCPQNPTDLSVRDLWHKPAEVAEFLKLDEKDGSS